MQKRDYEKEQGGTAESARRFSWGGVGITALTCIHKDHDVHALCARNVPVVPLSTRGERRRQGREDPPAFQAAEARRDREAQRALPAPQATPRCGPRRQKGEESAKEAREAMEAIEREARAQAGGDCREGQGRAGKKVSTSF